jgi:hypothetical protein
MSTIEITLLGLQFLIILKLIHNEYKIRKIIKRTKLIVEENNNILN